MTTISVDHWLTDSVQVRRRSAQPDDRGGQVVDWVDMGAIPARVSMPSGGAIPVMTEAQQSFSRAPYRVYLLPGADVQRGDLLITAEGRTLDVEAVTRPSVEVYRRAECREYQHEDTL